MRERLTKSDVKKIQEEIDIENWSREKNDRSGKGSTGLMAT